MKGRIHSVETCGTLDGPGIRFIIFMQGCPLRCQYCHNPDTWKIEDGKEVTVNEIMEEVVKYKSYMKFSGGGITVSGGEPLIQSNFVLELFKKCKEEGIHTALDTSGCIKLENVKEVLNYTDLVLLDIKFFDEVKYKEITGGNLELTIKFAKYLSLINKPMWVRYVLVPNLTDDLDIIEEMAEFLSTLKSLEKVEILPFHKMGEYKWEKLGYDYRLKKTKAPTKEIIEKVKSVFKKHGLNVK
ncbi:pyruvate formate-lyase-activating protein [Caminicella sporogenes]|nr:pyruvate formate-lyase-activating protein [Caminicella sporogenes]RKD22413.1 pyruvate formate-lyase 1-activating enzyme [Caminicella sporogenes]WIF95062.1 pyruvate formate-lyase-activating protein [Caminicella sporogenes]